MSYLYYYDKPEDGVPVLFKVNATSDEEAKDKIANYVLWSVENEVKFNLSEKGKELTKAKIHSIMKPISEDVWNFALNTRTTTLKLCYGNFYYMFEVY